MKLPGYSTLINEKKLTHLSKTFKSSTLQQLSMMDIYFLELRKGCRGYCLVNVFYYNIIHWLQLQHFCRVHRNFSISATATFTVLS